MLEAAYYYPHLGLALDPAYIEGFIEGCLERIGENNTNEERLFRDLWEDETQRDTVLDCLTADCEVKKGRPSGL
jgi:C4-type Zn-finger protein